MTPVDEPAAKQVWRRMGDLYRGFVVTSAAGLPNWRVVTWFPALATLSASILIALGISGTSSGAHWSLLGAGSDPRLISGVPRGIRSDEWLVQQGWIVSQHLRGFPAVNGLFPGGTDMTVLNELPSWDWSTLLRPHLWGHLLFGLDVGVAWQWWVPALALVISCYLFLVALVPRRPVTAALVAISLFFTPFLQWWYTASSFWCVAWPLLAMAGFIWIIRDGRLWVRVVWSAVIGYTAVTLAMGLYVPFILPGILVLLLMCVGFLLRDRPWRSGASAFFRRLVPLFASAAAAVLLIVGWVSSHWETFSAIQSTLYPGQRVDPTGAAFARDPFLLGILGSTWSESLKSVGGTTALGLNPSESSTVILLALFVAPGAIWFVARSLRRGRGLEWPLIAFLACLLTATAYLLIPGWDAVAHLFFLDRVPAERFRIVFVVLMPVAFAVIADYLDRHPRERTWPVGLVGGLFTTLVISAGWYVLKTHSPEVLGAASHWKIVAVLTVLCVGLLFVRPLITLAALLLLAATFVMSWGVNPVYRGVFDLSDTEAGRAIAEVDEEDPGTWIGIGSYEAMALLIESDVQSLSGVQTYPSPEMWAMIDPEGSYEQEWNRLAHIQWAFGTGEPTVSNPQPDVAVVTMDPCSSFAQENVQHIVSVEEAPSTECLAERESLLQGHLPLHVYDVVRPNDE